MKSMSGIEEECLSCHGTGKINQTKCPACDGTGTSLTEDGQKLLKFLRDCIRTSEH